MEFLPGCSKCFYYRSRWADVKKHCDRQHQVDIDSDGSEQGVAWGLTRLDDNTARPTYSSVDAADICSYPLRDEQLTLEQLRVVGSAQFVEPPGGQSERSRQPKAGSSRLKTQAQPSETQAQPSTSPVKPKSSSKRSRTPKTESSRQLRSGSESRSRSSKQRHQKTEQQSSQVKKKKTKPAEERTMVREQSASPERRNRSSPFSSTPSKSRVSLDFKDWSELSEPRTPARSLDLSQISSPVTRSASRRRRTLEEVVRELSTTAEETLDTVPELSSPAHISIPILEADGDDSSLAESIRSDKVTSPGRTTEVPEPTPESSSAAVERRGTGEQQSSPDRSSGRQSAGQPVMLLPPDIIISRPTSDRGEPDGPAPS